MGSSRTATLKISSVMHPATEGDEEEEVEEVKEVDGEEVGEVVGRKTKGFSSWVSPAILPLSPRR